MIRLLSYIFLVIIIVSPSVAQINEPERLTSHPAEDYDPAVSPDGRWLAFTSLRSGNEDIWLLDLKKRQLRQLTDHSTADYKPAFKSNDQLAFVSLRENALGDIFLLDIGSGEIKKVIAGAGYIDYPAISADGRYLAYCVSSGDDIIQIRIYDFKKKIISPGLTGFSPSFSHNGHKLIYSLPSSGTGRNEEFSIYDLRSDSSIYLDSGPGPVYHPGFTYDDQSIVFTAYKEDSNHDGTINRHDRGELIKYDISQAMQTNLFYTRDNIETPVIGGSRTHLYFTIRNERGYDIMRMDKAGPIDSSITETKADSLLKNSFTVEDSIIIAQAYLNLGGRSQDDIYYFKAANIFHRCGYLIEAERFFSNLADKPPGLHSGLAKIELARLSHQKSESDESIDAAAVYKKVLLKIVKDGTYPEAVRGGAQLELAKLSYQQGALNRSLKMFAALPGRYSSAPSVAAKAELTYLTIVKDNFPGDPLELVPLYLEISDKYSEVTGFVEQIDSSIVHMLKQSNNPEGYLRTLILNYPENSDLIGLAQINLARHLRYSGQDTEALALLQFLAGNMSLSPSLKFKTLRELSGYAQFQADYDLALAYSDSALILAEYGIAPVLIRDEKLRQASLLLDIAQKTAEKTSIEFYRKTLEIDPGNLQALYGFIEANREYGSRKEAERFIEINQDLARSQRLLARGLIELTFSNKHPFDDDAPIGMISKSSLKKAAGYIEESLSLNYNNIGAYISLAYVYCLLESSEARKEYAEKAVDLGLMGLALIDSATAPYIQAALYGNTAEAFYLIGNYTRAFEYFKRRLSLTEGFKSEQFRKAFLYKYAESAYQSDSTSEAFDLYLHLLELSAGDARLSAEISGKLGLICQLLDYHDLAHDYFNQALPFFQAGKDYSSLADVHKAIALSYLGLGELEKAKREAEIAAGYIAESGNEKRFKSQDRVIFSILNLHIPTFKMEPMKFGETEYPEGFTIGAEQAFIKAVAGDVAKGENDVFKLLADSKSKARILKDQDEADKLGTIYNSIGLEYMNLGYRDSAAVYFYLAINKAIKSENIIGAYNVLTNLGYALYELSSLTNTVPVNNRISSFRNKYGGFCRDINKLLPAEYYLARANVFIFWGFAEFYEALGDYSKKSFNTDVSDLVEYHDLTYASLDAFILKLESAELFFDSSLAIAKTNGFVDIQAAVMAHKGMISLYRGERSVAENYLRKARSLADITGSDLLRTRIAVTGLAEFGGAPDEYESVIRAIGQYPGGIAISALAMDRFFDRYYETCIASGEIEKLWNICQQRKSYKLVSAAACYPLGGKDHARVNQYLLELHRRAETIALLESQVRFYSRKRAAMSVWLNKVRTDLALARSNYSDLRRQIVTEFPDLERFLFIATPYLPRIQEAMIEGEVLIEIRAIEGRYYYWLFDKHNLQSEWIENIADIRFVQDTLSKDIEHLYISGDDDVPFWLNLADSLGITISFLVEAAELVDLKEIYHPQLDNKLLLYSHSHSAFSVQLGQTVGFDHCIGIDSLDANFGDHVRGYGFIHLCADFDFNLLCPPASRFTSVSRDLDLHRLYDMDMEAGLVYLDGIDLSGLSADLKSRILMGFWSVAGIQAICTADIQAGEAARIEFAKAFYANLDSLSSGQAYINALIELRANGFPDSVLSYFKYFGLPGYDSRGRRMLSEKIFFSRMLKGRRYSMKQDWPSAVDYYISAMELARETGFSDSLAIKEQIIANALEGDIYDIALEYQNENLKSAELSGDELMIAAANSRLESIHISAGNYKEAAGVRKNMMSGQSRSQLVESYEISADYYIHDGDVENALAALDSARTINYEMNNLSAAARISVLSGRLYLDQNRINDALVQLRLAANVLEKSNQGEIYAECLKHLGVAYNLAGYFYNARSTLYLAKAIYDELNKPTDVRDCYRDLAIGYLLTQRLDSAKACLEKASKGFGINADNQIIDGLIKKMAGDHEGAIEDFKTGINSAENDRRTLQRLHSEIAALYLEQELYMQAEDNFKLAVEYSENDQWAVYSLGDYYFKTGRLFQADSLLEVSLEIANNSGDRRLAGLCRYKLGLMALDYPDAAVLHFKAADSLAGQSNFYVLRNRARYQLFQTDIDGYNDEQLLESIRYSPPESPELAGWYGFDITEDEIISELVTNSIGNGNEEKALTWAELGRRRHFAGQMLIENINQPDYQITLNSLDSIFCSESKLDYYDIDANGVYTDLVYNYRFSLDDYITWGDKSSAFLSIYKYDSEIVQAVIIYNRSIIDTDSININERIIEFNYLDIILDKLAEANIETVYICMDNFEDADKLTSMMTSGYDLIYLPFLMIPDVSPLDLTEFGYRESKPAGGDNDIRGYLVDQAVKMSLLEENTESHDLSIAGEDFSNNPNISGTELVIFPYITTMDSYQARRNIFLTTLNGGKMGLLLSGRQSDEEIALYIKRFCRRLFQGLSVKQAHHEAVGDKSNAPFIISIF